MCFYWRCVFLFYQNSMADRLQTPQWLMLSVSLTGSRIWNVPVIEYLDSVSGGRTIYPECGQHHSMGCVAPDSIERSELGTSIHLPLFILTTGTVWPTVWPSPCCHDFPIMMDCTLGTVDQINPSVSCICQSTVSDKEEMKLMNTTSMPTGSTLQCVWDVSTKTCSLVHAKQHQPSKQIRLSSQISRENSPSKDRPSSISLHKPKPGLWRQIAQCCKYSWWHPKLLAS